MEKGWLCLEDQVVIVTGGASGIGKHMVQMLAKAGAKAVAADMTVNTGDEMDGAWCVKCDVVTSPDSVKAMADAVVDKYGKINALVNNAGINRPRRDWKAEVLHKQAQKNCPGFFAAYSDTPFRIPSGPAVTGSGAQTAVYVLSRIAGENKDRIAEKGDYYLSDDEYRMLADICLQYKTVVVILNVGSVTDLSFIDEFQNIQAVLFAGQPGMEGGNAVADVLSGKVTPSGKLTDTWALQYKDYPNSTAFSHNDGDVFHERYAEGIYVGYRYFDSFAVPARYRFGFGLSYTHFSIEAAEIRADKAGTVTILADVTNTGAVHSGREVVQVYVSLPEGSWRRSTAVCAPLPRQESLPLGSGSDWSWVSPLGN